MAHHEIPGLDEAKKKLQEYDLANDLRDALEKAIAEAPAARQAWLDAKSMLAISDAKREALKSLAKALNIPEADIAAAEAAGRAMRVERHELTEAVATAQGRQKSAETDLGEAELQWEAAVKDITSLVADVPTEKIEAWANEVEQALSSVDEQDIRASQIAIGRAFAADNVDDDWVPPDPSADFNDKLLALINAHEARAARQLELTEAEAALAEATEALDAFNREMSEHIARALDEGPTSAGASSAATGPVAAPTIPSSPQQGSGSASSCTS